MSYLCRFIFNLILPFLEVCILVKKETLRIDKNEPINHHGKVRSSKTTHDSKGFFSLFCQVKLVEEALRKRIRMVLRLKILMVMEWALLARNNWILKKRMLCSWTWSILTKRHRYLWRIFKWFISVSDGSIKRVLRQDDRWEYLREKDQGIWVLQQKNFPYARPDLCRNLLV